MDYYKKYYQKNKDRILARNKKYRKTYKKQKTEIDKEYYRKNKKKILAYRKRWREENKERIKIQRKEYRNNHKEEKKIYDIQYRGLNQDKLNEGAKVRGKIWRDNNKDKLAAKQAIRRVLILDRTSSDADLEKIKEYYLLAERLTESIGIKYVVDHIIPLSKGGLHHQNNLQVITAKENGEKFNKYPYKVLHHFNPEMSVVVHS